MSRSLEPIRRLGLTAAVILSACGGGGGGDSPAPPAPPPDGEPDAFTIVPAANAARGTQVTSMAVMISGINVAVPVSVAGGEYSASGRAFTSGAGTIANGQSIVVRLSAADVAGGVAEATLTVGGVAAKFTVTTSTDVTPPTAAVIFPAGAARTSAPELIVRGRATDTESAVRSVRVNGIEATSSDAFATWTATVPLVTGANTISIDAEDVALNRSAATQALAVTRNALIGSIEGLAFDVAGRRVLAADATARVLLSIDLATGLRTVASKNSPVIQNEQLWNASSLSLESNGTHALLLSGGTTAAILRVALATGGRTLVSGRGVPDEQSPFGTALDMAVDATNGNAYVLGFEPESVPARPVIHRVDLATGARTVFSSATIPDANHFFLSPVSIALDPTHHRLLVGDQHGSGPSNHKIYAVDLTTGARSILSSNTIPDAANPLSYVAALAVDAPRNRALVTQPQSGSIVAVDLDTGARTVLAAAQSPSATDPFEQPHAITIDSGSGRAVVADAQWRSLVAVDLATGARTTLSANEPADIGARQVQLRGIALDLATNRLYVTGGSSRTLNAVDLATGARTAIAKGMVGWNFPTDLVLDAPGSRLLVADIVDFSIYAVDLGTGLRSVLSSNSMPGTGVALGSPTGLALDPARSRLLVTDMFANRVIGVDTTSGARTIVADNGSPPGGSPLASPEGIAVDAAGQRVLVANAGDGTIVAVDLGTGVRSAFVTSQTGAATSIAIDDATRTVVSGHSFGALDAIDPVTGARALVSSEARPRVDDPLNPRAIAVDGGRKIAWVTNERYAIPQAVDLVTGERVFVTR